MSSLIPQVEKILVRVSSDQENLEQINIHETVVHKKNFLNVLISNISEHKISYDSNPNEKISFYTCKGKPNLIFPFIFDHPQDHYPIMLLIEMGRQIAISISHLFKNIPLETSKNTVDELIFTIEDFIELDEPLVIGCIDRITKNKRNIQIRELQFLFYQNGLKCAESKSMVSIMSNDIYNRYRLASRRNTLGNPNVTNLATNEIIHSQKFSKSTHAISGVKTHNNRQLANEQTLNKL